MSHEEGCLACRDDDPLCYNPGCCSCSCEAIRAAYQRGREDALAPVRELADKFEHENDGNAVLRYKLAAARIWGAIKEGEQE